MAVWEGIFLRDRDGLQVSHFTDGDRLYWIKMNPNENRLEAGDDFIMCDQGEDTLEKVIGERLLKNGFTFALAESCTGGLIAARLTGIPGSSVYFAGGVVAYANSVKEKVLGVSKEILEIYGAVSPNVAEAMALGARNLFQVSLGLGVTGIAGPAGGTTEKPVGLVYIALATFKGVSHQKFIFSGERNDIRKAASQAGLQMILDYCRNTCLVQP